jgi:hypothetical protein
MIGAAFIITDLIFQGLAISLVFGLASSTLLTVLVIPALYVWLRDDERGFEPARRSTARCPRNSDRTMTAKIGANRHRISVESGG